MPKGSLKLFNRRSLTDKDAFKFYREHSEHRNIDNVNRKETHSRIVRKFYNKIADKMVENPNGVFIENFGYFTMLMNPKKTTVNIKRFWTRKKLFLNPHTEGRVFHPIFLPIVKNFNFKLFIMDKSFNRNLKQRLKDKLIQGVKYLNHYGILNSMYKYKR